MPNFNRIQHIRNILPKLTEYQIESISRIVDQFQTLHTFIRNNNSDLITNEVLQDFGDALRIHHVFSAEALSKDRFEYALERVLRGRGISAELAPKGNPGHDLTIRNTRVSLKTQADKAIKADSIHISKFMELGKGEWTDKIDDLHNLMMRFLEHLKRYERIFILRRLNSKLHENYEFVEIPKDLLLRANYGELRVHMGSKQNPKPGYCTVLHEQNIAFELYFDGGTERKLQIKNLRKDLCIVHATWEFPRQEIDKDQIHDTGLLL